MPYCSDCGYNLRDDANFCSECGKRNIYRPDQQPIENLKNDAGILPAQETSEAIKRSEGIVTEGEIDFKSGNYIGQLVNGLPDGEGTWNGPDGRKYVGDFKNGKRHGSGKSTLSGVDERVGEWQHGRFVKGRAELSDGRVYDGEFLNGKAHGKGTLIEIDGTKITETWKHGKRHHINVPGNKDEKLKNTSNTLNIDKGNKYMRAGFILGIISIFIGGFAGIIPVIAIILSGIGLSKVKNEEGVKKWEGTVGLVLGIIYLIVNMYNYGHFG